MESSGACSAESGYWEFFAWKGLKFCLIIKIKERNHRIKLLLPIYFTPQLLQEYNNIVSLKQTLMIIYRSVHIYYSKNSFTINPYFGYRLNVYLCSLFVIFLLLFIGFILTFELNRIHYIMYYKTVRKTDGFIHEKLSISHYHIFTDMYTAAAVVAVLRRRRALEVALQFTAATNIASSAVERTAWKQSNRKVNIQLYYTTYNILL